KTSNLELTENDLHQHPLQLIPGPYIFLSVKDTGVGMSEEVQAHIFEPFFTTKEKDQGTGLGLYSVYGIVKQNGGDIAVQSRVGSGTVVEIYLARGKDAVPTPIVEQPPAAPRGHETVLVVEDEDLVRRVVRKILHNQGYAVVEARGGNEALALCERLTDGLDLLITDVVMPEMNGRQLAHLISARLPGLPVLYMSGYTADVIGHRGVLEPGVAFIEKSAISNDL